MSILPPGDILLEVSRAADPEAVAAAHARLRAGATGRVETSFDVASPHSSRESSPTKPPEHYIQFEAMVLQSFLKSMLPDEAGGHYGEGLSGEMWRDLFADALGMALAQRGGIGIAVRVFDKKGSVERPPAPGLGAIDGAAATEADMAAALITEIQRQIAKRLDEDAQTSASKVS